MTTSAEALRTPAFFERDTNARIEKIRSDIATRLGKCCGHLPQAEFVALVDDMTRVQIVGEKRAR